MKKNFLKIILTLILVHGWNCNYLWSVPNLFRNYSHYYSYEKETFTTSHKLELSMTEGRFSVNSKGNYNYGLSIFSDNYLKNFPTKCNIGNLSIGGIISKLNNPMIDTSTSGFTACYSQPSIVTSSLPSNNSFTNPFSIFFETSWVNEKTFIKEACLNNAYTPDSKALSFSSKINFGFTENFELTNTLGFSIFTLKENNSNSWYLTLPYFPETGSFCFAGQIEMELFNLRSNFSVFSYKSPLPDSKNNKIIENIFRTDNKFETNHFQISIALLFNNNPHIISRDNKVLKPTTQIKSNIQYKNDFGHNDDYSFRAGITTYSNISAYYNENDDFKLGLSTSFTSPLASVLLEGNLSYAFFQDSKTLKLNFASANIENIWHLGFFSPSLGISSQYYISSANNDVSENYKINLGLNLWNSTIINDNSFSFSLKKNAICNKKLKTGININFSFKNILISAKIAGEFCI